MVSTVASVRLAIAERPLGPAAAMTPWTSLRGMVICVAGLGYRVFNEPVGRKSSDFVAGNP